MISNDDRLTPVEEYERQRIRWRPAAALVLVFALGTFVFWTYFVEHPVDYTRADEHFKYGSIGSDSDDGIPYWVWKVLPEAFPQHLPGKPQADLEGYAQFGFLVEQGRDLPIGFSKRRVQFDRVGLNCAVCHVSTLRVAEGLNPAAIYGEEPAYLSDAKERIVILGMPANTVDLQKYFQFLFDCAADPRFTIDHLMTFISQRTRLGPVERLLYSQAIPRLRERLLERRAELGFLAEVPEFGPGRVDTFNPYKTMVFGFPYDGTVGTADFPSLWNQRPRQGMQLHWDGNNRSVIERNISAALGAGATPVSLDQHRMLRVATWCGAPNPLEPDSPRSRPSLGGSQTTPTAPSDEVPVPRPGELPIPRFPFPIDGPAAERGAAVYRRECAECHDWKGKSVGRVVSIGRIGTDSERWRSYTRELAVNQSTLGTGHWWRFRNFRITEGYANMPLDGIWARAPYLHNGSVPTLRELLTPATERVTEFYRGDDVYLPADVGFRYTSAVSEDGRPLFRFDTTQRGNGNGGHEYGTGLSNPQIDDLLEYLKTL